MNLKMQESNASVVVEKPIPEVLGNRTILSQIVSNLLSNAVKFVAPGIKPKIKIRAEYYDNSVRLWVEDNGIGIEPEYQQRIFRLFERLHSAEEYPGTGIGLAIVAKGAERMGGKTGVESAPGKGSRFWVELPMVNNG
jgi:signal transduction histidine kinase